MGEHVDAPATIVFSLFYVVFSLGEYLLIIFFSYVLKLFRYQQASSDRDYKGKNMIFSNFSYNFYI
jgi:hypothetical protein